jgi:hypothetical protein
MKQQQLPAYYDDESFTVTWGEAETEGAKAYWCWMEVNGRPHLMDKPIAKLLGYTDV